MNIIVGIEPRSKRRGIYALHLDDGRSFFLDEEVIVKYRLMSGMEVDSKELAQWIYEADIRQAYSMSLRYLGYRARSSRELSNYLTKKRFSQKAIDATIEKLKEYSFLDDEAFADLWVRNKKAGKPVGKRWIAHELKGKGIAPDIVEDALEAITPEDEEEQAYVLGQKYYNKFKQLPHNELKAKIGQALQRRGFNWQSATAAINRLLAEEAEELYD